MGVWAIRADPPSGIAPWAASAAALGAAVGVSVAGPAPLLLEATAGLAALAAVTLRPQWLPAALAVTIFAESVAVGGLTLARLAAPVAVAVVTLRLAVGGRVAAPRAGVLIVAGAYATWAAASWLWSVDGDWALDRPGTAYSLASLAIAVAYMLAFATLVESRRDVLRVVVAVWATAVVLGVVGTVQYLGSGSRGSGYVGDPNFFAVFELAALPMTLVLARRVQHRLARVAIHVGAGVIAGSVLTSLSRGGLLGLGAVLLALAAQPARPVFGSARRKVVLVAVLLLGTAVVGATTYDGLAQRSASVFNSPDAGSGRAQLWHAAWTSVRERPVLGLGYGTFQLESNDLLRRTPSVDFSDYRLRRDGQPAHNAYLGTLAELGVPGLALFVALLVAGLSSLRRTARHAERAGDAFVATVARASTLALGAFAVTAVFLSSETSRVLWLLLGLSLALARLVAPATAKAGSS